MRNIDPSTAEFSIELFAGFRSQLVGLKLQPLEFPLRLDPVNPGKILDLHTKGAPAEERNRLGIHAEPS